MTFYLKPPRGEIHLDKIIDLGLKRLRFLSKIRDQPLEDFPDILADNIDLTEAIVEDTPKDRVSHFILKTVAASTTDFDRTQTSCYQFKEFVLEQEMQLFHWRNHGLSPETRHRSLCGLQRHLRQNLCGRKHLSRDVIHLLDTISEIIDQQVLFEESDSRRTEIGIPSHLVPNLVAQRHVSSVMDWHLLQRTMSWIF